MALSKKPNSAPSSIAVGEPSPERGPPSQYEGHLIAINSGKAEKIYHVEGGRKRYIAGPKVFESQGFDWGAIMFIPQSDVDSLPNGPDINSIGSAAVPAHPAMSNASVPPPIAVRSQYDGKLIKSSAPGSSRIYHVEGGQKRWIVSPEVFTSNGFDWGAIMLVPQSDIDAIANGPDVTQVGKFVAPPEVSDKRKYTDLSLQITDTALGVVAGYFGGPAVGNSAFQLGETGRKALDDSGVLDS